ncbi:MAG: M12 family metallo-peptidase [Gammaproteobacteria bacterium]|nr:M12 family metallo-peptidase [Gammaproteobacteria bacterium]
MLIGINSAHAGFWQADNTANRLASGSNAMGLSFIADEQGLRDFLGRVPAETSGQSLEIELPMPDGSLARYGIVEYSMMEAGLAEKYPDIKTFKVYGIDYPGASGRVDISSKGFRGMLHTSQGRVFIDPDQGSSSSNRYMSRSAGAESTGGTFQCSTSQLVENKSTLTATTDSLAYRTTAYRTSGFISTYRLAVSATRHYVDAVGTSKAEAMAEIINAINRVNEIYERDLSIRLLIVASNDQLIDDTGTVNPDFYDAYGNEKDGASLLNVNQDWIDTKITSGNYDVGHIFTTGGGGVAGLGVVCNSSVKARGVTGLPGSYLKSDMFYIDFLSHEIGHQFGAEHSFNGTTGGCFGNRSPLPSHFEPGSGSTIMAYAGTCGAENIQLNSNATFHAGSISQIDTFVSSGGGASCRSNLAVSNTDPSANANANSITNFTIPQNTAFQLVGSGTDSDLVGDTLSYQWDQMDTGTATDCLTLGQDLNDNALFRSYEPRPSGERDFPALGTQLHNLDDPSEVLPSTARSLNFRLTVRDGNSGQATDNITLNVDSGSGPFRITSHTTSQSIHESDNTDTLRWDVAGTDVAPVNCPNVDIDLLTFSADHSSYSVNPLKTATPNDGYELISLLGIFNASIARYRIRCSNNFFYDISDADLVFVGSSGSFPTTGNSTEFNTEGQNAFDASAGTCTVTTGGTNGFGGGGGSGGGGSLNFSWLFALLGLMISQTRLARVTSQYRIKAYTQS